MSLKIFTKRMLIGMRSFLIRFESKPKSSISFNRSLAIWWTMSKCTKSRRKPNGTRKDVNGDCHLSLSNKKRFSSRNSATLTNLFEMNLSKMIFSLQVQCLIWTAHPLCISIIMLAVKGALRERIIITVWIVVLPNSDVICHRTIASAKEWLLQIRKAMLILGNLTWWKTDAVESIIWDMKWREMKARAVQTSKRSKYVSNKTALWDWITKITFWTVLISANVKLTIKQAFSWLRWTISHILQLEDQAWCQLMETLSSKTVLRVTQY